MKVSLNWIKEYLKFELPPINEFVEKIGSQLGAVESVTDLSKKYQGILIVKVVNCDPHPDADRLRVCKLDDGGKIQNVSRDENGFVQVVCGAPNAREGLMAVWIPPGVAVPESLNAEPFVLEVRDFRGQSSNGMLASPKELALSDEHQGILEVNGNAYPGQAFADVYGLNDCIIDLENKMFTHRPDCFGLLGIAREIAGIYSHNFQSPDWYQLNPQLPSQENNEFSLKVNNEIPAAVPRFSAAIVANVEVKASPQEVMAKLTRLGMRPVNNIVDLTNYYMLLSGQPLHAYDYDKVKNLSGDGSVTLVVRYPKAGEKIKLLNGREVEPNSEAIIIATDQEGIGLGGIMGGSQTEVDEKTKNVIIESANFDMYSIRRTAMAEGLFTDAVTRFTKGQSPLQNLAVLAEILSDIEKLTGGKVVGSVVDNNHLPEEMLSRGSVHPPVSVSADFIISRLGIKLSVEEITKLLENVEFIVQPDNDSQLVVKAPFWRTDIEIPEDLVEEVGRLYGYDKLLLELPKRSISPAPKDQLLSAKTAIRARLSKAGANEALTYSFVPGSLLDKVGQDKAKAYQLANALSPDLQYYRLSLIPSLLDKVHLNIKAGYDEFALFELGKSHAVDQGLDEKSLPREFDFTALVIAAADKLAKTSSAYFQAQHFLKNLVKPNEIEFKPLSAELQSYSVTQPYEPNRSAIVSLKGGEFLGIIGEFKSSVRRALKLPNYCAGFEVDTDVLASVLAQSSTYTALSRFPKVTQDITLKVPAELSYQDIKELVNQKTNQLKPANSTLEFKALGIYQRPDDKAHKQVTFRLNIASYERTLTDSEVSELLDKVVEAIKTTVGVERI